MRRILVSLLIVIAIGGAALMAYNLIPSLNGGGKKQALLNSLFAPQIAQVDLIGDSMARQFAAYAQASEDVQPEQIERATEIIEQGEEAMRRQVRETLAEIYTLEELREKKRYEASALAENLEQNEREALALMHVLGKRLGRVAIMRNVEKEFSEEETEGLKAIIADLTTNTSMPDDKRAELIADKMDMAKDQANIMLTLLSVKKADIVKEQNVMDFSAQNISAAQIERAQKYVELTRLDQVFDETVSEMVKEAAIQDAFEDARERMVTGVAHIYDAETLEQANAYFSQDIAQRILTKDLQVATTVSPHIRTEVQKMNERLKGLIEGGIEKP